MRLEGKRKFLLVFPSDEQLEVTRQAIDRHVVQTQFFTARDGAEATAKVGNDPPHVVVVDKNAAKVNGIKLTQWLLADAQYKEVAVIVVGAIPDQDTFVDEVVIGRVQFIEDLEDEDKLARCLSRTLNYHNRDEKQEFHLKFLSKGDYLIRLGETAEFVYIVRRGNLEASIEKNGEKTVLGPVDSGEFVGEMAYINGEPRNADVRALTDCELIEIPIEIMDKVLFHKPSWSKALMRTLSRRVKLANEHQKVGD